MNSSHSNNIQYFDKCPLTQLIYQLEQNFSILFYIFILWYLCIYEKSRLVSCKHT